MSGLYDLCLANARVGVMQRESEACVRAFDRLVALYGSEMAGAAWRQACQEADAEQAS